MTAFTNTCQEDLTTPLVSIVIPTFNRRDLVCEAIKSCLAQDYQNIEIIIVDDGSTDGTKECLESIFTDQETGRISYKWQRNSGAPRARNAGVAAAKGEYIQFLDSDDVLFRNKIASQVLAFQNSLREIDVVSCYGLFLNNSDGVQRKTRIGRSGEKPADYIRELCGREVHAMQTSAPLWRRDFLIARPGWREDLDFSQDLEYYARLLVEVKGVDFVHHELFMVREHSGKRVSDFRGNRARILSSFEGLDSLIESVSRIGLWDTIVQRRIERKMMSLYVNMLRSTNSEDIEKYEGWARHLVSTREGLTLMGYLMAVRQLIGKRRLLKTYDGLTNLRRRVGGFI